jgi:Mce-associated membrane protein
MSEQEPAVRTASPAPESTTDVLEAAGRAHPADPADPPQSPRSPRPVRAPRRIRSPLRLVRLLRGTTLLVVVAVLLAAAGGLLYARTAQMRNSDAATNRAVTDAAATQAVLTEVGRAVETIFSYSYRDPAATARAAGQLLAGPAKAEYDQLFVQVTREAPQQRLTLTTRVAAAGVSELRGDRASVLLFLDQSYTYGDGRPARTAAAQLEVTARRDGAQWKITEIESR